MEVILREDVAHLGGVGEVVKVKNGYARNYLIPHGKAYLATEGSKRQVAAERKQRDDRLAMERSDADRVAGELAAVTLSFTAKTGDGNRLFGSITAGDIADKLAAAGHEIDKRIIELHDPIKIIGEHRVPIRLHADVRPEILISVTKES